MTGEVGSIHVIGDEEDQLIVAHRRGDVARDVARRTKDATAT